MSLHFHNPLTQSLSVPKSNFFPVPNQNYSVARINNAFVRNEFQNSRPFQIPYIQNNVGNPISIHSLPNSVQKPNSFTLNSSQKYQNQIILDPNPKYFNIKHNDNSYSIVNQVTPKFIRRTTPNPINPINMTLTFPARQNTFISFNHPQIIANDPTQFNEHTPTENKQLVMLPSNDQISNFLPAISNSNNKGQNFLNSEKITGELKNAGPQRVRTETFQTQAGIATRTTIQEPFYIEQPPKVSKIITLVNKPLTIQPPPKTQIVEEVVNTPYIIQPPPKKTIVREVINKPVEIHQAPERQIIRETYQTSILYQPPPEKIVVNEKVQNKILVNQPPKTIIKRTEYTEPPIILEDNNEIPLSNINQAHQLNSHPQISGQIIYPDSFIQPTQIIISSVENEPEINQIPQAIPQIRKLLINNVSPHLTTNENQYIPNPIQPSGINSQPQVVNLAPQNIYPFIINNNGNNYIPQIINKIPQNISSQNFTQVGNYPNLITPHPTSQGMILNAFPNGIQQNSLQPTFNQINNNIPNQNISQMQYFPQPLIFPNNISPGPALNPVLNIEPPPLADSNPVNQMINYQPTPIINQQNFDYPYIPNIQYQVDQNNMSFSQQDNISHLESPKNFYNFGKGDIVDIPSQIK